MRLGTIDQPKPSKNLPSVENSARSKTLPKQGGKKTQKANKWDGEKLKLAGSRDQSFPLLKILEPSFSRTGKYQDKTSSPLNTRSLGADLSSPQAVATIQPALLRLPIKTIANRQSIMLPRQSTYGKSESEFSESKSTNRKSIGHMKELNQIKSSILFIPNRMVTESYQESHFVKFKELQSGDAFESKLNDLRDNHQGSMRMAEAMTRNKQVKSDYLVLSEKKVIFFASTATRDWRILTRCEST